MATSGRKINPNILEEQLRDEAARDYCVRLAQEIRAHEAYKLLTAEEKASFTSAWVQAFRDEPAEATATIEQIAVLLYRNPHAQARIANLTEYPPGKWLLEQELTALGKWPPEDSGKDVYTVAAELKLSGICFSGGGIRSATFNLGILQGLATLDRLDSFDYLSTVSGGGYIHQFLASWIAYEDIEKVKEQLQPLPSPPSKRDFWPEPLRWLRRYSNYLTPQVGLFSADTWVAFAIWLRNTFLNQIVLVSSILLVLLIPHFYLSSRGQVAHRLLDHGFVTASIIFAGFLFASSVIFFTQMTHPPAAHCNPQEERGLGQLGVMSLIYIPIVIAVLALCPYLYRSSFWSGVRLPDFDPRVVKIVDWPENTGIVPVSTRHYISHLHRLAPKEPPKPADPAKPTLPPPGDPDGLDNLRAWQSAYSFHWWSPIHHFNEDTSTSWVFTSMLAGIALLVLSAARSIPQNWRRLIVLLAMAGAVGCGYLLINLSRLVIFAVSFFLPLEDITRAAIPLLPWAGVTIVFVSIEIAGGLVGNLVDESVREWFARLRAWSFLTCIVWFAFTASSLLGPALVSWLFRVAHVGKPLWIGWLGTTLASVLAGKSSLVSGKPGSEKSKTSMLLNGLVLLGPPVFIAGLVLSLSWVVEKALLVIEARFGNAILPHFDFFMLLVILAGTALLFGWRIDINEFSLHSFYRDRIARCYAGASNPDRRANRFTGFAPSDKRLRVVDLLPARFNAPALRSLWAPSCGPDPCFPEPQAPLTRGRFPSSIPPSISPLARTSPTRSAKAHRSSSLRSIVATT